MLQRNLAAKCWQPPTKLCSIIAHNFMFYNVGSGRQYGFITFCYVTRSKRLTSGRSCKCQMSLIFYSCYVYTGTFNVLKYFKDLFLM